MSRPESEQVGGAGARVKQRRPIDWTTVRQRMERVRAALDDAAVATPEEKAAILKARARALAREPVEAQRPERSLDVIEFMIAYERYALESAYVREVHPLKDLTPLPGTPAFVAGIVNVRGRIVSVIDLKQFFDLPRRGLTDLNRVIILDNGQMEFGLLVDAVTAVQRLGLDDIQPALPTLTGVRTDYLHGVTAQRTIVLDAAKILADRQIICDR